MNILSLCTGYGGLDLAAETVFDARVVLTAENEPAAARVCYQRFPVPNLGDIRHRTDWDFIVPGMADRVDIITAGYPCQPFSQAGRRKGTDDERHLWPHVMAAIRGVRPQIIILENVPGHRAMGFDAVLGDLARSGYDAGWCSLRAYDVGAAHNRQRVFIYAWPTPHPKRKRGRQSRAGSNERAGGAPKEPRGNRAARVPDPDRAGLQRLHVSRDGSGQRLIGPGGLGVSAGGPAITDAESVGRAGPVLAPPHVVSDGPEFAFASENGGAWGRFGKAITRWEAISGYPAPVPTLAGRRGSPRLNPAFVEWLMGLPPGWVTDVPGISRNAQLKLLGNGVVPLQAVAALRFLQTVRDTHGEPVTR